MAYHLYANDTQMFLAFSPWKESEAHKKLELWLQDVRLGMASNYLKPNDSKTDFMILASGHNLTGIESNHIKIGDELVPPSILDQQTENEQTYQIVLQKCQLGNI